MISLKTKKFKMARSFVRTSGLGQNQERCHQFRTRGFTLNFFSPPNKNCNQSSSFYFYGVSVLSSLHKFAQTALEFLNSKIFRQKPSAHLKAGASYHSLAASNLPAFEC